MRNLLAVGMVCLSFGSAKADWYMARLDDQTCVPLKAANTSWSEPADVAKYFKGLGGQPEVFTWQLNPDGVSFHVLNGGVRTTDIVIFANLKRCHVVMAIPH